MLLKRVIAVTAQGFAGREFARLTAGQTAIIPAGRKHGFTNIGSGILRVQAILASPVFEAAYDDKRETPRRWLPPANG